MLIFHYTYDKGEQKCSYFYVLMTKMKEMLIFRYTYEQKSHATAFFIRRMTKNRPQACCGMR